MVIVVCMEERRGMLFNKRRVSRDTVVYQDLLNSCPQKLWMNRYSSPLFSQFPQERLGIAEDFLQQAAAGDWCFVENQRLQPYEPVIEAVVIYQWNRRYPADFYFDLDLTSGSYSRRKNLPVLPMKKLQKNFTGDRLYETEAITNYLDGDTYFLPAGSDGLFRCAGNCSQGR